MTNVEGRMSKGRRLFGRFSGSQKFGQRKVRLWNGFRFSHVQRRPGLAVSPFNKRHHFIEGGAGEKYFIHAAPFHDVGIGRGNRAAAAAEHADVARALLAELLQHLAEKFDVPAVVG